jgi:hypothetical protein
VLASDVDIVILATPRLPSAALRSRNQRR